MKCKICNNYEANQTGAHIFPAWMITSAFDDKSRNRGHEIIYSTKSYGFSFPYFGRSVLPDKVKENVGRDISDNEAKNQANELVVDNLWCRDCEKRFKIIEDYFLDYVDKKLDKFIDDNSKLEVVELNDTNNYLIRLFIYSLIYRAFLVKFIYLNSKTSKKLRLFLDNFLKTDIKSIIEKIEKSDCKDQLLKFPIRCIKTEQKIGNTSNFVYLPYGLTKPNCLIINQYIIQFYGKGNQTQFSSKSFFGISSLISGSKNIRNYKETQFKVGLINLELWNEIKATYNKWLVEKTNFNLIVLYKGMFKMKFGRNPNQDQISLFLKELINNKEPTGIKYTDEKILEAMNRSINNCTTANKGYKI